MHDDFNEGSKTSSMTFGAMDFALPNGLHLVFYVEPW